MSEGVRDDMRERLRSLGAKNVFINNGLGFTEMRGTTVECAELGGSHNPSPDMFYFEVVDENGKRLPDGAQGLLALTHLNRRGTVLLRYLTGDLATISHEICPHCGRNGQRLTLTEGSAYAIRTKDLIKFKGNLIKPVLLTDVLAQIPGVVEYQVVFAKENPADPYSMDDLLIHVALDGDRKLHEVENEIIHQIQQAVEIRPKVIELDKEQIFDTSQSVKATRILDKRPKLT